MLVMKGGEPCAPGEYGYYKEEPVPPRKLIPRHHYDALLSLRDPKYPEYTDMAIRVPVIIVRHMNMPHTPTFRVVSFAHIDNHGNPERPNITSQITEDGFLSPTEQIMYEGFCVPTGYFLPRRTEED